MPINNSHVISGGGEMGKLIREFDWTTTSLGEVATWPQSLRTTLSIILNSKFPMFLWWGQDLIQFYNDAYRPSLGNDGKHPSALGQRGQDCWPEIWPIIKPLIDGVLSGGEAIWREDQLIPIYRNGRIEDVYWTFSYSPVSDERGEIAGVLVTCMETIQKVTTFKQLEESKNQLAFAIEATELATWDLNPITNQFTANARYSEWFGLPAAEETDNGLALKVIAEEDRERVMAAYTKAMDYSSGTKYDIEYRIRPENKPERILRAKGKASFGEDKIAYRFNGTLQDVTEQVLARKKLEASEAKLRSIIAAAPAAIGLFIGRDLIIEHPNQTFINIVGKGPDIVGKPLREAMPELITEGQPFLQILDDVYTSGKMFQSFGSQVKIVQNGVMTYSYYNFTYTPLFDAQGKVYAILDIAIDVTGEIKARKSLEESEARFRSLAQNSPDVITRHDTNHKYLYASPRIEKFTGIKAEAFTGKSYRELGLSEELCSLFDQHLDIVFRNQTLHTLEYAMPDDRGHIHSRMVPEFNEAGEVDSVLVLSTDISEIKKAEKALKDSEARYKSIYNADEIGVVFANFQGVIVEANDAFLGIIGYSHEMLQAGQVRWNELTPPEYLALDEERAVELLERGEATPFEKQYIHKDGHRIDVWIGGIALVKGQPELIVSCVLDITHRKRSELALKESEARFRTVIAKATVATGIYTGREMKIEFANDAMIQLWGKDASVIGKTIRQALPELENQPFHQLLDNVYATENTYWGKEDQVDLMVNGKLQIGYFNFTYKALRNGEGEIYGILNMAIDVTETVLARKRIEESEQRFRLLADQVPQFVWMTSKTVEKGIEITYSNKNFLDYLGLSHYTEFLGTTWEHTIHPDDLGRVYEIYLPAAQARQAYKVECRFKEAATGVYRWFIIHGVPRYEETGEFTGYIGTGVDINDRKQSEAALVESEERFRALADNISQLAWMADGQGWIFWYNKRWYDYTGTNLEEMQGWGWEKVHHPDHIERVLAFVKPAWKKGEAWELEFPLRQYDGQYKWFLTRAVPIRDAEGNLVRWFGTNTDITEQKMAEQHLQALNEELAATTEELTASNEELRETNQQLVRINADLDNFVYTASHDLKAPITNIEGLMRILERSLSSEKHQKDHIQKLIPLIYSSVDRFKGTIADLTEVAKVQKEEQEAVTEVNLWEMVEEVKSDLSQLITEAEAHIESNIDHKQLLRFSRKNLKSVIYNLLSNAIKYRSPKRKLLIGMSSEKLPEYVLFIIEDNGLGMNLKDENQIFGIFKRLHNHVEGSGIGLYIVKKIIENANGRIQVESNVEQGSVFKVYFRV
jgi:PAS domain S-box-containing protein